MSKNNTPGARRVVPRSRGALSGIALIALGLWGALIPFIGPYFNFSFSPDDAWHWTAARGWLEVLPGAAAALAGVLLLMTRSRLTTLVAAWLGIAAGAWFAVGPQLQDVWHIGSPGQPAGTGTGVRALEALALFTLLGVVIVYFAATAFGRLSVVSLRDAHAAERREAEAAAQAERERQIAAARDRDAAAAREREAAEAAAAHERRAAGQDDDQNVPQDATADASDDDAAHDAEPATAATSAPESAQRGHAGDTEDPGAPRGRGAHVVTQDDAGRQAPAPQAREPQRAYEQPQAYPTQPAFEQQPAYTPQQQPQQPEHRQPQQGPPAQQQVFGQPDPASQGYAQPQRYDAQHGYAQQSPDGPGEPPADDDAEHEGPARRLFHRR